MKRFVSLILLFSVLLSGCSSLGVRIKDPVTFYYIRNDYREDMGSVVEAEVREASGHRYDLPYLLALYSMGPSDEELRSPIPGNITILPVEHSEDGLVLSLLDDTHVMTDAEFTLASVCLALTCMDLIEVEQVTLVCGDRSVTINADNLLMNGSNYLKLPEDTK